MTAPRDVEAAFAEVTIARRGVHPDSFAADDCRLDATALLASPALAALVARERAEVLREAASDPTARLSGHSGVSVRWLRDRADQITTTTEEKS